MSRASKRSAGTATALAGGALLAWLLLRTKGGGGAPNAARRAPTRARIRVAGDGITVDGRPTTLELAASAAIRAGAAEIVATGDARTGTVTELVTVLTAAGVELHAAPDVLALARTGGGRAR